MKCLYGPKIKGREREITMELVMEFLRGNMEVLSTPWAMSPLQMLYLQLKFRKKIGIFFNLYLYLNLLFRYLTPWDSFFLHPIVFDIWWLACNSDRIDVQMKLGVEPDHICPDMRCDGKDHCIACLP